MWEEHSAHTTGLFGNVHVYYKEWPISAALVTIIEVSMATWIYPTPCLQPCYHQKKQSKTKQNRKQEWNQPCCMTQHLSEFKLFTLRPPQSDHYLFLFYKGCYCSDFFSFKLLRIAQGILNELLELTVIKQNKTKKKHLNSRFLYPSNYLQYMQRIH